MTQLTTLPHSSVKNLLWASSCFNDTFWGGNKMDPERVVDLLMELDASKLVVT